MNEQSLKEQLREAYDLLIDARQLVGQWPAEFAGEVDEWTRKYEAENN